MTISPLWNPILRAMMFPAKALMTHEGWGCPDHHHRTNPSSHHFKYEPHSSSMAAQMLNLFYYSCKEVKKNTPPLCWQCKSYLGRIVIRCPIIKSFFFRGGKCDKILILVFYFIFDKNRGLAWDKMSVFDITM
jgi:hypothetical protein